MSIIKQIAAQRHAFRMRHDDTPDRLIINYDRYNELRAELGSMGYFSYPANIETFMGMKVITTSVPIEGGFEVR